MDATELIQRAAARGIDFVHVAGISSDTDGIARQRKLTPAERKQRGEDRLSLEIQETVRGQQTRSYRRAAWTVAELGQAANGLGAVPWAAALYSFAGAMDGYKILWHALANEAQKLARRQDWPIDVIHEDGKRRCYREHLAKLVLYEDANKHLFSTVPQLFAVYMEVPFTVWDRQLNDPYRSLKDAYDRWLAIARGSISRWINGERT